MISENRKKLDAVWQWLKTKYQDCIMTISVDSDFDKALHKIPFEYWPDLDKVVTVKIADNIVGTFLESRLGDDLISQFNLDYCQHCKRVGPKVKADCEGCFDE